METSAPYLARMKPVIILYELFFGRQLLNFYNEKKTSSHQTSM